METIDEGTFHYPPELLSLLTETIPLLCRSKRDVLVFFRGAGVPTSWLAPFESQLRDAPDSVRKHATAQSLLTKMNEAGDAGLRLRREVVKRVVEFEDFSTCWPSDQLKAKGLVSEVRRVIGVKDAFARMNQERENEARSRREASKARSEELARQSAERDRLRRDIGGLFALADAHERGRRLEGLLNALFEWSGCRVREAFTLRAASNQVIEQVDGAVELDGDLYLVEAKWHREPLGVAEISQPLVRMYQRAEARGLIISGSGYTQPAITTAEAALQNKVIVLAELEEIVMLLETGGTVPAWLRGKVQAAVLERRPFHRFTGTE